MSEATATTDAPVVAQRRGRLGHLLLNRPRAINALTHEMIGLIQAALDEWRDDDAVTTVLLTGAGQRGLCAGGDIVALYHDALAGGERAEAFWADEYRLNADIARYPKPFVVFMDGIVLGGGIGLSAHAEVRVVTERSSIGMPETGIGFVPDVGGTWLLSRAPGQLGTHLALTAGSVEGAANALHVGLADRFVPADRLTELATALETQDVADALARFVDEPGDASLRAEQAWIDAAYDHDDVREILAALDAAGEVGEQDAARAAATIRVKSPTSCVVTLRALRAATGFAALEEALDQEFRLALRLHARPDFAEGVRAQVVDKDRNPAWNPPTLDAVDPADVDACFAPLGPRELGLSATSKENA